MTVIAACQLALSVGDVAANRAAASAAVTEAAGRGADLVLLPELCDTGYVFSGPDEARALAAPAAGHPTLGEWRSLAREHGVVVAGGFCELGEDGRLYNSAAILDGDGVLAIYRKAHLWDAEKLVFTPGDEPPPVVDLLRGREPKGRGGVLEEERQASPREPKGRGGVLEEERQASLRAPERRGKDTASKEARRRAGPALRAPERRGKDTASQAPRRRAGRYGRVGLMICYDLEFPEWLRLAALAGADLVVAPVNWPATPVPAGERPCDVVRVQAEASMNRVFIAVADRCRIERGVAWVGGTVIVGPDGYPLAGPVAADRPEILIAACDLSVARDKSVSARNDVLTDRRPGLYGGVAK